MNNLSKIFKGFIIAVSSLTLVACVATPQPTVTLDTNYFKDESLKIGIVYLPPEKEATTHISGANCLLCYGVASALTATLDTHLAESISDEELLNIRNLIRTEYSQRSSETQIIELNKPISDLADFNGELGFARKDFRPLKKELDIDLLVVFQVSAHGTYRTFFDYIPTGDPKGYIGAILYSVDLNNNAYVQYEDLTEKVQPEGAWDEPSDFPSVTTSYYQAVENVKEKIRKSI